MKRLDFAAMVRRRRPVTAVMVLALAAAGALTWAYTGRTGTRHAAPCQGPAHPEPVANHPRLLVRPGDLDRLRSWATAGNPVYAEGIAQLGHEAKIDMDAGTVPGADGGGKAYEEYPTEQYAELFAFLSLIEPDRATRDDYGRRACGLLMDVIRTAAKGPRKSSAFRDPAFATSDRSRWSGEAFGLAMDWAYPYFSAEEKATARKVFLRWGDELIHAHTTDRNHPEPIGVRNDPALLTDRTSVRWSLNNYYTAHMRNLGFMALSMDEPDDPDGALRGLLANATGAWMYVIDHALRTDALGGLGPEGFEYGPQSAAYVVQFLTALHTAGRADPATLGPQVVLADNPFWDSYLPALLHSMSPAPVARPEDEGGGQMYQPSWFGSGQVYETPDMVESLGPLALYAADRGDRRTVDAIRWMQTHTAPGGGTRLLARIDDAEESFRAILYFLLFDPAAAPEPVDPRPGLPLAHFAPGINKLLARTDWGPDASWFSYNLGWQAVDHQHGDGNNFELYRRGEWLTKQQVRYSAMASDHHNTLAIKNDPPEYNDPDDYVHGLGVRGSQWTLDAAGDPVVVARSAGDGFLHVSGDATNLYNSTYQKVTDVVHASRSLVWLQPDVVVVYDRAETRKDDRFKRFWLQLTGEARVDGRVTTARTPMRQQVFVSTLLPAAAAVTVEAAPRDDDVAVGDPIRYRLMVEDPAQPRRVDFLHVVEGADATATASPTTVLRSTSGTPYVGAAVGGTAVLFPVDLSPTVERFTVDVPAGTGRIIVTGLQPGAGYGVTATATELTVVAGGPSQRAADPGGVLIVPIG